MTERLYYNDSYLAEFQAAVSDVREVVRREGASQWQIALDRTAFYPTSGGQPFDTGVLRATSRSGSDLDVPVIEVEEDDQGEIWHSSEKVLQPGTKVRGMIDMTRRRDHMQQHSGQHVLSAAFLRQFGFPTVSFHLGADLCSIDLGSIDLAAPSLDYEQVVAAERFANEIVTEDRPVRVEYTTLDLARQRGVRKIPDREGEIRLIDIADFDLNACGGTHVARTGEIGAILLRKIQKVTQGTRVEFLCGARSVRSARLDFDLLGEAAGMLSAAPQNLPDSVGKMIEQAKSAGKERARLLEQIAELEGDALAAGAPSQAGVRVVAALVERDLPFLKLMASRIVRRHKEIVVLSASSTEPGVVIAQSPEQPANLGAVLKKVLSESGIRGGGSKDMAQCGAHSPESARSILRSVASELGLNMPGQPAPGIVAGDSKR